MGFEIVYGSESMRSRRSTGAFVILFGEAGEGAILILLLLFVVAGYGLGYDFCFVKELISCCYLI